MPLGLAQQRRGRARRRRASSSATSLISTIWSRNHGSIPVASKTCSTVAPGAQRLLHGDDPAVGRAPAAASSSSSLSPRLARAQWNCEPLLLQRAQRLLQRLGEVAADRHRLADRLHGGGQRGVGGRELLEREPRHLDHDVVERRLEGRRGHLGDVVGDLVEACSRWRAWRRSWRSGSRWPWRPAREERETRGFISMTMIRPSAGSIANWMLQPPVSTPTARMIVDADVAQLLVLAVGQGQRRGDGDRVAGVHAHRVDVLDRADDHDVVVPCRASARARTPSSRGSTPRAAPRWSASACRPCAGDAAQVVLVVGEAGAEAAHGERRADDERVAAGRRRRRGTSSIVWQIARTARPISAPTASTTLLEAAGGPRPCWIASTLAPISSTPYFSRTPGSCSAIAALSAVWPPRVGRIASGRSLAMIVSTTSGVIGST